MSNRLQSYLSACEGDLPTMPAIAGQIVQAVDHPDASIDDIRSLIQQDAAIAARILKILNSALYGFPSEIQSLSHAISLLGTMTVRNLVLAASMKETDRRFGFLEKLLWQHSSLAGPVAAMLAGTGASPSTPTSPSQPASCITSARPRSRTAIATSTSGSCRPCTTKAGA
jgi:HD-like signal output (HDOD) protein